MQRSEESANAGKRPSMGAVGVVSALTTLAFVAGGTAAVETKASNAGDRVSTATFGKTDDVREATPTKATVGALRALGIATAAVRNGKVFDMELDRERVGPVWDFDVASGGADYDVRINARSGKVLNVERDRTPDTGMRLLKTAKIKAVNAARTATGAVPGATLHGLELDRWRTRVVWKSDLVTRQGVEYDVNVDARTGKVLSKRIDD